MGLARVATNGLQRVTTGLARASPIAGQVRRIAGAVSAVASAPGISAIPGAGIVNTLARTAAIGAGAIEKLGSRG